MAVILFIATKSSYDVIQHCGNITFLIVKFETLFYAQWVMWLFYNQCQKLRKLLLT